jgi:predicted RNA-binding Zn-ribbon protein involved in translation (DUF1610 family)
MNILQRCESTMEHVQKKVKQVCPQCGAAMLEAGRLREEGALYVWYVCSREDCDGRWLSKN